MTPLVVMWLWIVQSLSRRSARSQGGGSGYWWLKLCLLLCSAAFVLPVVGILNVNHLTLGTNNVWTAAIFGGSVLLPAAAILAFLFTVDAWRGGAGRALRIYAVSVSIAALVISGYLSSWGMIGFRPWSF
jgi:hypothetical protein